MATPKSTQGDERVEYVVEVMSGGKWRKKRGPEGGPWSTRGRAERIAEACEREERRTSSTAGLPHRVTERQVERDTPEMSPEGHRTFAREYRRHGDYEAAEMHDREAEA